MTSDHCATCRAPLEPRQEYCLECGARVAAPRRRPRHWLWPTAVALLVAAGGAAAAIAAGGHEGDRGTIVALSPLRPAPTAAVAGSQAKPRTLVSWPRRDGHTVVVAVLPEAAGRKAAIARAQEAIAAGLPEVGILQSSRYASLHPGYALVFSGVYQSRDEALLALPRVARRFPGAYAQEIAR